MKLLTIVILIVIVQGCHESKERKDRTDGFTPILQSKEDSLYHHVMQGHDIGMAKMGILRKQLTRVQKTLDSINKLPSPKIDNNYKQALLGLREELSYADHAMFAWMQEFEVDSARDDKEKRLRYLESEKLKVEKVRDHILNSLSRADSLFKARL